MDGTAPVNRERARGIAQLHIDSVFFLQIQIQPHGLLQLAPAHSNKFRTFAFEERLSASEDKLSTRHKLTLCTKNPPQSPTLTFSYPLLRDSEWPIGICIRETDDGPETVKDGEQRKDAGHYTTPNRLSCSFFLQTQPLNTPRYDGGFDEGASVIYNGSVIIAQSVPRYRAHPSSASTSTTAWARSGSPKGRKPTTKGP
ncbi:hypothetical protein B0H14DRAFT_2614239 [Mycena olivaceomarginata]|nr:hypothetical protein B0H14DRAFT_2614239 [Mycena olivaceomarginata]